tara:strand:+ start:394 stop:666 length:273 start_codon:yes stop_codon:yes gene_type:complete
MLIEAAIESFERIGKRMRKEKKELLEINSVLEGVGISSVEAQTINNIDKILNDYDVAIPALKQHLSEGNRVIYSGEYFKRVVERYKNNKN